MNDFDRPDPDALLKAIEKEEGEKRIGQLRIFFGMSAGVGKTYAMLSAAHARKKEGVDVIIGTVDTHGRKETLALLDGLTLIPRKKIEYKGATLEEMDLDAILKRNPKLVLVDELAHTNMPGSRHHKRYQDVFELLDHGIDVYTTLNVQHLESRKDAVEQISGVVVRETVPDSVLERASQIELVDISPSELLKRMREGKVYLGDRAEAAQKNFFKEAPLTALREIALRITAERVDQDLRSFMEHERIQGPWRASERLMVAVSHSPYSERLIRATRRLAYSLEAPWIAVNIDTGTALSDQDQAQLMKNLNLVRELGGEVVTTTEPDVPLALDKVARLKNVTQIVVGRPTRRWLRDYLEGGSLLDRLVRESGDLDIHVIRQESGKRSALKNNFRFSLHSSFADYWNVAWIFMAVTILGVLVKSLVGYKAVGFFFLLAVLGVSLVFSMGPVLLAACSSALIWDYVFIPPRLTFSITEHEDVIMCITYFLTALTTGVLANRIRFHEMLLQSREERSTLLYEVVSDLVTAERRSDYIQAICERLEKLLGGECAILLRNPAGTLEVVDHARHPFLHNEKEIAVASWVLEADKKAGWSTDTLSEAQALYTPLKGRGAAIGVLAFRPASRFKLGVDRENLLATVARQMAIALEREMFELRARENQKFQESERLHQTLLDSVSHELRTPLTTLMGAANAALREVPDRSRALYSQEIHSASERLNRVIENLLDMTRLSSGVHSLKKEWEDVADVIGVVLRKLGALRESHNIKTEISPNLSLVNIDFRLMEHVISNLIYNSILYSPKQTTILVRANAQAEFLSLSVEDEGPGVPMADLNRIFEKFYRAPGTPAGGTGLGLAIAKSIVELHGGRIYAEARSPKGLKIVVMLPLGKPPELPE